MCFSQLFRLSPQNRTHLVVTRRFDGCSVCSLWFLSPTDPSASQTHSEERLNHEAQELEKRLSMLSHRSSAGRAASLSCCCSDSKQENGFLL